MSITIHIKSYVLGTIIIVSGALFWYISQNAIKELTLSTYASLNVLAIFSVYMVAISLGLLLMERMGTFLASVIVSFLPVFFFFGVTPLEAGMFALAVGLAARSFILAENERMERIKFSLSQTLRRSLPVFFTALALLVASTYILAAEGGAFRLTGEKLLPRTWFDAGVHMLSPLVAGKLVPGFDPNMTVDTYILSTVSAHAGISASSIPASEREQALAAARERFFKDFNVSLSGSESLGDVFYSAAVKKSDDLISAYERIIPFAFAVSIFLVLKTISVPYLILVVFVTWLIMELLIGLKIVERHSVETQREDVRWR